MRSWMESIWMPPVAGGIALVLLASACGGAAQLPTARATEGHATPVAVSSALPSGHPEVPVGEPASNDGRVGRAARRLNVEQLRASLEAATGFTWVASRRVFDPDSPSGFSQLPDADMLEALAATLGRPDYVTSTSESIEPAVTFAKLAGDAARSACRAAVMADVEGKAVDGVVSPPRILRHAAPRDTLASNAAAVKKNLAYMALRFWGRHVAPQSADLAPLVKLFERASTAPASTDTTGVKRAAATPADGWRAACIAMVTDPQFLTY